MHSRSTETTRGRRHRAFFGAAAAATALVIAGCGLASPAAPGTATDPAAPSTSSTAGQGAGPGGGGMTMEQTLSDQAQLTTIAFDGLAFLTGSLGSDSFFPPGKVADFWGFQYLRDNDPSGMGHNTDFLTSAALNVLTILDTDQRAQLISLARSQVADINRYGYQRFTLMSAFRRLLSGRLPSGTTTLSPTAVAQYSAALYRLDGDVSLARARVMGALLHGLTDTQRAQLDALVGKGMKTWPTATEPGDLRSLSGDEKVAVMTYAADMLAWYGGDVEADVYFCPERQGTYFGSFYLKDAPAVGNPGYSIGTNITGDMGRAFLSVLTPAQRARVTSLVDQQRASLTAIVETRRQVATQLRTALDGGTPDASSVATLMSRYGSLDGAIVTQYATAFTAVSRTLTSSQRQALMALRHQLIGDLAPKGAFLYAQPIAMPAIAGTDAYFTGASTPTISPSSSRVRAGRSLVVRVTTPGTLGSGRTALYATPRGGRSTVVATWPTTSAASTRSVTWWPRRTSTLAAVHRSSSGTVRRSRAVVVTVLPPASS